MEFKGGWSKIGSCNVTYLRGSSRKNWSHNWGQAIKFMCHLVAFPSCANADLHSVIELDRHESTQLNCQYHSSAGGPLEFGWSMNSSKDSVDIPKSQFTSNGDKSVLTFSAKTEMDYGTLTCHASDAVGPASRPCTFQIIPKGDINLIIDYQDSCFWPLDPAVIALGYLQAFMVCFLTKCFLVHNLPFYTYLSISNWHYYSFFVLKNVNKKRWKALKHSRTRDWFFCVSTLHCSLLYFQFTLIFKLKRISLYLLAFIRLRANINESALIVFDTIVLEGCY